MNEEIIGKITREKGWEYAIDKNGNILKRKYNLLRDPYTLVTVAIIILALFFYIEMKHSETNAQNFDEYCVKYIGLREDYILNNPGEELTFEKVIKYAEKKTGGGYDKP